jgi:hypothetical protein
VAWISKKNAFEEISGAFGDFTPDEKTLKNWTIDGAEIPTIKQKNRWGFDDALVDEWVARTRNSLVFLDRDDYIGCFKFAVEAYYSQMTRADFNRGKQRDVGEFLTNQLIGKLGELAVASHVMNYGLEIKLDFNVNGQIPSQDITQISTRPKIWNNPAIKVSIKSTKLKNILLALPLNELSMEDRRSDLYILAQVGLFSDHLLRIMKSSKLDVLTDVERLIPEFDVIPARIGGWVSYQELVASGPLSVSTINDRFGITMAGDNYIRTTGELRTDWTAMCSLIIGR